MAARSTSLSARLLVTTAILLLAAFALTIFLLDTLFRQTSENAIRDLLEIQVLALISVAEPVGGELVLPEGLGTDTGRMLPCGFCARWSRGFGAA